MTVNRGDRVGVADPGFAVIGGEPSPAEWIIRAARDPPGRFARGSASRTCMASTGEEEGMP